MVDWIEEYSGRLLIRLAHWPIRHLFRFLGKLASLGDYIGGSTPLEKCRAELVQCQTDLEANNAELEKSLDEAAKADIQLEAANISFRESAYIVASAYYQPSYNRVCYSLLVAEHFYNENAQSLLREELDMHRRRLSGMEQIISGLQSSNLMSRKLPGNSPKPQRQVILYTLSSNLLVEVVGPHKILAELRQLEGLQEVKDNSDLLPVLQDTIRFYDREYPAP